MRLLAVLSLSVLFCVSAMAQSYTIQTFAGGGLPNNVSATSVRLPEIGGVAVDSAGNVYLSVPAWSVIYQLNASTKNLVLFAGNGTEGFSGDGGPAASAQLRWPYGLAVDASGNLYIADTGNNAIRKISNGTITTIAGTGHIAEGYSGDGAKATSAQLNQPYGVAVDSSGNVYIADTGNSVVREVTSGNISTFAGDGTAGYAGDGAAATAAELNLPRGVAVDTSGHVYIADTGNNVVRGITVSNGNITTIAGDGTPGYSGDGAAATSAELSQPYGVAVDASGNVYIADSNNNVVREVAASNAFISTFAGNNTEGFSGDGAAATSAELNEPNAVALDAAGNLYIVDSGNGRIRKVSSATITTIAGGGLGNFGDGGAATSAGLSSPQSVALDAAGNLYIADTLNHVIRKVSGGVITTVAGNGTAGSKGDGGAATSAQLHWPYGVALDASGNLYIADTGNNAIREVSIATGLISTIAGGGTQGGALYNGPATSAGLSAPNGVAVDAAGNVYIADTGNNVIRKVSGGTITTLAGNGYGAGTIYCSYFGDGGLATSAELCAPTSVAVDASGNVYIADNGNDLIREVSGGNISKIAGGGTDTAPEFTGLAISAKLNGPRGVALDTAGNLYIADTENNVIRVVANGMIASIAGNGTAGYSGDYGPATSAELAWPYSVAVRADGTVYIADTLNDVIRFLDPLSAQGASLTAAAGGGSVQVGVAAGVAWTAVSNDSWIIITSGASGAGSGSVSFSLDANGGAARTGTITIAGQTFTVTQAGASSGLSAAGSMAQIASAGGWETSLTLVNLGTAQGEAELNFYANDGTMPLLPFTFPQQSNLGTILGSTFDEHLAANATLVLDTTGPASQAATGWSQLLTSGNIDGFAIFKYVPTGQEAVVPLETRNASSYLLAFDNTGQLATGLAIANLATSAANVGVIIRDDTGAQIGTDTIALAAQGHNSFMLTDATSGFPITAAKRGTVEFDTPSGGQISVLGLRANGAALTSLPVLANVGTAGGTMAQVASGGGWQTLFTLVNTGTSSATATLNFFGDNGSPLSLPLSFPQGGPSVQESSVSQTIPAGATLLISTAGDSAVNSVTGSAQLTTSGNVSGFAIFQESGQEAVVPLEVGSANSYTLVFDNTNNLATGIALANDSAQQVSVPVTLRNGTGLALAATTVVLPANGHVSEMLTNLFPAATNIGGTVEFDTPSGGQIAALGIRATPANAFTTIPVMTQ